MKELAPWLATQTPGMSGADIASVCNEAALGAARAVRGHVTRDDFSDAVERLLLGQKKHNATPLSERMHHAVHEAGHVVVSWCVTSAPRVQRVSLTPRLGGEDPLGTILKAPTELKIFSKEQLVDRMCVSLAGRAAECIVFNSLTTGVHLLYCLILDIFP